MKKTILAAIIATLATTAFAQQTEDTASIQLRGVVEKFVSITATGTGNYDDLDLGTDVSDLAVVTVVETSNVREGYTVELSSANAANSASENAFFRGIDGDERLDYTISYDGAPVTFSGGSAEVTNGNGKTTLNGATKTLSISYEAADAHLGNDTYVDDLTFTIRAK